MDHDSKLITEAWYRSLKPKDQPKVNVLSKAHHRNGVSGAPFDVYLFEDEVEDLKVAIDFGGDQFAVLSVNQLNEGDISMGSNSHRGDVYAPVVRGTHEYNARRKEVSRRTLTPDDEVKLSDFTGEAVEEATHPTADRIAHLRQKIGTLYKLSPSEITLNRFLDKLEAMLDRALKMFGSSSPENSRPEFY